MSGPRPTRVYLAGPEVFLPEAWQVAERKKAICHQHGFNGVVALDTTLDLTGVVAREAGYRISQANETLIRSCELLVANLTPFRGPSADVGTAYELGFMRGLGLCCSSTRPVRVHVSGGG